MTQPFFSVTLGDAVMWNTLYLNTINMSIGLNNLAIVEVDDGVSNGQSYDSGGCRTSAERVWIIHEGDEAMVNRSVS